MSEKTYYCIVVDKKTNKIIKEYTIKVVEIYVVGRVLSLFKQDQKYIKNLRKYNIEDCVIDYCEEN